LWDCKRSGKNCPSGATVWRSPCIVTTL
jgi:hypothetical protein